MVYHRGKGRRRRPFIGVSEECKKGFFLHTVVWSIKNRCRKSAAVVDAKKSECENPKLLFKKIQFSTMFATKVRLLLLSFSLPLATTSLDLSPGERSKVARILKDNGWKNVTLVRKTHLMDS